MKMCLNWKVAGGLAAVGLGLFLVAPNVAATALPFLILAVCPLSMLLMMGAMGGMKMGGMKGNQCAAEPEPASIRTDIGSAPDTDLAVLKSQLAAIEVEQAAIRTAIAQREAIEGSAAVREAEAVAGAAAERAAGPA